MKPMRLPLVPDVVAGGDAVDAGGVEIVADLLGDAEAAGRVLAIATTKSSPIAPQRRHALDHRRRGPTGRRCRRRTEGAWLQYRAHGADHLGRPLAKRCAASRSRSSPAAGRSRRAARAPPPGRRRRRRRPADRPRCRRAACPACGHRSRRHSRADSPRRRRPAAARSAAAAPPPARSAAALGPEAAAHQLDRPAASGGRSAARPLHDHRQPDRMARACSCASSGFDVDLVAHRPIAGDGERLPARGPNS